MIMNSNTKVTKQCIVCGKPFKPKNSKGVYCSSKCKMQDVRAKKQKASTGMPSIYGIITDKWIQDIMNYCKEQSITPEDLIEFHKKGSKKQFTKKEYVEIATGKMTGGSYLEKRRNQKLGLKKE